MCDQLIVGAATYTTHNTLKRKTSLPPAGSEPAISATELPPTYALDRAANEIENLEYIKKICKCTTVVNILQRDQREKNNCCPFREKVARTHNFFTFSFTNIYVHNLSFYFTLIDL